MENATSSVGSRPGSVIICPRIEGHRLSYVRLLVSRAVECGETVEILAPTGTRDAPEFALHLGEHIATIQLREVDDFTAASLQSFLNERPGGMFIFPDGDDAVRLLAVRKLRPAGAAMSVLMMRPLGQSRRSFKRVLESAAKKVMRGLARTHRGVQIFSLVPSTTASVGSCEVRDPIEFNPGASLPDWRSADPSLLWFGVVGAITSRKNVDLVSRALAQLGPEVGLVVAGASEVEESTIEEWTAPMREAGQSVVRINRRVSDEELDSIIASLDVAVIAHSNDGPSGIMGKADVAGKRVLAAGAPTLRRELRMNTDLGVWTALNASALADGARLLLSLPARRESGQARGRRDAFSRALRREDEEG